MARMRTDPDCFPTGNFAQLALRGESAERPGFERGERTITDSGRTWRRRAPVAAVVAVLAIAPLGTGAGADPAQPQARDGGVSPQDQFVIGSGRARASLFEIVPRTGGLEIPVNFGKALVTYQGLSATATSGGVKPPSQNSADGDCGGGFQPPGGGKGPGGGGPPGGLPAPPKPPGGGGNGPSTSFPFVSKISVSTGDKDAAKGRQIDQGHFPDGGPVTGAMERQEVAADDAPSGRAATTSARLAFGPVAEVVNGRTEAQSGVVDHKARQAHAVTAIDRLSLLGGKIVLGDLRWEANQRTGDGARADGGFTVGSVLLDGKPLPAPTAPPKLPALPGAPGSGAPTLPDPLAALNTALAPTGIAVVAPHLETVDGVVDVTPMSLRFADSALGRQVLGPIVGDLQPLRDPIVGGLLAASCDFGTAVTVADVATSILAGAGGIRFDFGGVSATTEGEHYDNPLAGGPGDTGDLGGGIGAGDNGLPELPPPAATAAESGPAMTTAPAPGNGDLGAGAGEAFGTPSGSGAAVGANPAAGAGNNGGSGGGETALGPSSGLFGPASQHLPGHKGGRALAVALLALLTIGALAAADAFHLRRASRSIS